MAVIEEHRVPTAALYATPVRLVDLSTARMELTLDPEPRSPRIARRSVAEFLRRKGATDDLVNTAALLVSEVVTNAVVHARTVVRVRCEVERLGARIEVADESTSEPIVWEHDVDALAGRGLVLVDALATAHGVRSTKAGKVVWFVVGDVS